MNKSSICAIVALVAVSGCADKILSNDRIRDNTAMALGQPEGAVTISNRRYDGMTNTYYNAKTSRGWYTCTINGGSVLAMGMTNPPTCTPSGRERG